MKKITLLMGAAFLSVSAFAQSLTSDAGANSSVLEGNAAILWNQPSDPNGTSGIVSTINNLDIAVYSADDFILAQTSDIEMVFVNGFNNNQNMVIDLEAVSLYIYAQDDFLDVPASDPSLPGTGLLEIIELDALDAAVTVTQTTNFFSFEIDIVEATGSALTLPAGTYWLVFAPKIDIPDFDGASRWNWGQGLAGAPGTSEAHLIDVDDVFGGGFTSWTAFSALGLTWSALQFRIEGEPVLSVGDNLMSLISVYPNPASDILNVKVPASVEITNVNMYDLLGRNTGAIISNGTIDISNLSKGVYLLSLETNQGALTQKVVKK